MASNSQFRKTIMHNKTTKNSDYLTLHSNTVPNQEHQTDAALLISSEEELSEVFVKPPLSSIEGNARPVTPGMSLNIASTINQINANQDIDVDENDYSEPRVTLLPSETNHGITTDSESLFNESQRSSSKQVFPYISCLPFENNVVFCFVLSAWDNIVGPQSIFVWKKKSLPNLDNLEEFISQEKPKSTLKIKQTRRSSLGQGLYSEYRRLSVAEEATANSKSSYFENDNIALQDELTSSLPPIVEFKTQTTDSVKDFRANYTVRTDAEQKSNMVYPLDKSIHMSTMSNKDRFVIQGSNSRRLSACEEMTGAGSFSSLDKRIKDNSNKSQSDEETSTMKTSLSQEVSNTLKNLSLSDISEQTSSEENIDQKDVKIKRSISNASYLASNEGEVDHGWVRRRGRLKLSTVVKYVTEHSVGVGELGQAHHKLTTSLLMVPHLSIIVVAARFIVVEEGLGVPYCLSMVIPLEEQEYIIPLVEFITNSLLRSAAVARLLITKNGLEGSSAIKGRLVELCQILVALRKASLDQYPLCPAGKPPEDRRVAELVLTSHLQTLGTTVVIGDTPTAANKVVMWLGQYSRPEDLHVSRLCLSFVQWPYHPGLAIQGVVRNLSGEVNLSSQDLLTSHRPLTVVDLTHGSVRQTLHTLATNNVNTFRQELLGLWHDIPSLGSPSQSLLTAVKTVAPIVRKFLHDLDSLGSCEAEVKQHFISSFMRSLQYTALALITWTQHEWTSKKKHSTYSSLKQALMSVFMLELADLQILLAQAEYLQPGFHTLVSS